MLSIFYEESESEIRLKNGNIMGNAKSREYLGKNLKVSFVYVRFG